MPTRVRFRLNKVTGEVEEFLVDDQDRRLPEAEHDRIAQAVGQLLERLPLITEVEGAAPVVTTHTAQPVAEPETPQAEPARQTERP